MTLALRLAMLKKHQPKENMEVFVSEISEMSPHLVSEPSRLRTFTIVLINAGEWELAKDWSQRWSQLEGQSEAQRIDGLWHYGIVLEQDRKWIELLNVCKELLSLHPKEPLHAQVVGLRTRAHGELKNIIELNDPTTD